MLYHIRMTYIIIPYNCYTYVYNRTSWWLMMMMILIIRWNRVCPIFKLSPGPSEGSRFQKSSHFFWLRSFVLWQDMLLKNQSNIWTTFKINIYKHDNMIDWWFGTMEFWMTFQYWEFHKPNWRSPSFFRGVGLNHQPDEDYCLVSIFWVQFWKALETTRSGKEAQWGFRWLRSPGGQVYGNYFKHQTWRNHQRKNLKKP